MNNNESFRHLSMTTKRALCQVFIELHNKFHIYSNFLSMYSKMTCKYNLSLYENIKMNWKRKLHFNHVNLHYSHNFFRFRTNWLLGIEKYCKCAVEFFFSLPNQSPIVFVSFPLSRFFFFLSLPLFPVGRQPSRFFLLCIETKCTLQGGSPPSVEKGWWLTTLPSLSQCNKTSINLSLTNYPGSYLISSLLKIVTVNHCSVSGKQIFQNRVSTFI